MLIAAAWIFTISFLFSHYWSYRASPSSFKQKLEHRIQKKIKEFNEVISSLNFNQSQSQIADQLKLLTLQEDNRNETAYFLYQSNDLGEPILSYWSSHLINPEKNFCFYPEGNYFIQQQNGYFIYTVKKIESQQREFTILGVIPVYWKYFLENKYLTSEFAEFEHLSELYSIANFEAGYPIIDSSGKTLFSIKQIKSIDQISPDAITVLLRIISVILILLFVNKKCHELLKRKRNLKATAFLILFVLVFRYVTFYTGFPFNLNYFQLFDPTIYASSFINKSLGDLLINILLVLWVCNFIKKQKEFLQIPKPRTKQLALGIYVIIQLTLFLIALYGFRLQRSLIEDSNISFDVSNFFSLNLYSVLGFIIIGLIYYGFYLIVHISKIIISKLEVHSFLHQLLITSLSGLFIIFILGFGKNGFLHLSVLLWFCVFISIFNWQEITTEKSFLKTSFFILWLLFFALSATILINTQIRRVELAKRINLAEKLSDQSDPSGENLFGIALSNINESWFLDNFHRFYNPLSNKFLKDSLIIQNFSGYLNKYDTRVYVFDSLYQPLFNEDSVKFSTIKNIALNEGKKTAIPNLYYYDRNVDKFSFLYYLPIKQQQATLGYFVINAKLKRYKNEALFPELFKVAKTVTNDLNINYAYAIYKDNKLINAFSDYAFAERLNASQLPKLLYEERKNGVYSELWYKTAANKLVILVKKEISFLDTVTLFAYLFCSFLLIVFIIFLFQKWQQISISNFQWKQFIRMSLKNQVIITVVFISTFSFIVIGFATISFFIISFNNNNKERLKRSIQVMTNEIESTIGSQIELSTASIFFDNGASNGLDNTIAEISDIHNVDVNFYDVSGQLRTSTQPYIYSKGVLSNKMDPHAFDALAQKKLNQYIHEEQVGNFKYLSIYVPVHDSEGNVFAFLNIPYLNSQKELNQEISSFLVTLINLNALIFLIAGMVAFFFSNRITASFAFIEAKMKAINLAGVNEEVTWDRNDEIGTLVKEYNKMVKKLEESAKALARTEREGAWKEMAKQVAHEIKNPLTPMKLSLQHLQRAIANNQDNAKELATRMAQTLVEQIDQLAKIASDFSKFANIGLAKPTIVVLEKTILSVINLYKGHERLEIIHNLHDKEHKIWIDSIQLNRLFTNLIQNAVEASTNQPQMQIEIMVLDAENFVTISIKDNGEGISEFMKHRIFEPNVTTKTTGTGLGLAMCKGIVENAEGQIWFESQEGVGTTFFIQFPLV